MAEWNKQLLDWYENQTTYSTISEAANAVGLPRRTLSNYMHGDVKDLSRVNPENLRKLYETTRIEALSPDNMKKLYETKDNQSLLTSRPPRPPRTPLEKMVFKPNPYVDARRVNNYLVNAVWFLGLIRYT